MSILDFILTNTDYLQDLITRSTYHSNAKELSSKEEERMAKFGYKK